MSKGRRCSWGTLRIPAGKIEGRLGVNDQKLTKTGRFGLKEVGLCLGGFGLSSWAI